MDQTAPGREPFGKGHLAVWLLLAFGLVFHTAVACIGWTHSVNEGNGFRQAQTALATREMLAHGVRLDYEIPVFGPQSQAPFEFPVYQACVVALVRATGLPLEPAGRTVSLLFFYATLAPLYGLARRLGASVSTAGLAVAFALLSPVYLYWSREFLIESTALFFTISFAALTAESLRGGWRRPVVMALLFLSGILGGLTKITTFALAAPVILLLFVEWYRTTGRTLSRREQLRALGPPVVAGTISLAVALAWVHYSDAVKARGPLTALLTSHALHDWNYGTWAQRRDRQVWWNVAYYSFRPMLGAAHLDGVAYTVFVQAVFLTMLATSARRGRVLALLAAFVLGPALFLNLYRVHPYYWFANDIYYLLALALLIGGWLESDRPARRRSAWAAAAVVLLGMTGGYFRTQYLYQRAEPQPERLRVAAFVNAHVPPGKMLLIFGDYGWNPQMSYHTGRRALMADLPPSIFAPDLSPALAQYPPATFGALVLFPSTAWPDVERMYGISKMGFSAVPDAEDQGIRVYLCATARSDAAP